MVLLGIVVWVVEGPGPDPFNAVPHISVEDGHKLEERVRAGRKLQAATRVRVRRALKSKPLCNP